MPDWISVKDRLPEESGYYLIYCKDRFSNIIPYSAKRKAFNAYDDDKDDKYVMHDVTHWMPLPAPPEDVS